MAVGAFIFVFMAAGINEDKPAIMDCERYMVKGTNYYNFTDPSCATKANGEK